MVFVSHPPALLSSHVGVLSFMPRSGAALLIFGAKKLSDVAFDLAFKQPCD